MLYRTKLTLTIGLFILLTCSAFSLILYQTQKKSLLEGIDTELLVAATFAKGLLPDNYHDSLIDKNSVSPEEFDKIVDRYNRLCLQLGMQYLWSCMVLDGQIVFTSSTSPGKDIKARDHANFFDVHSDPEAFNHAFTTMRVDHSSFKNQWGYGRQVLLPFQDTRGRKYCFGASMSVNDVYSILQKTFFQTITLSGLLLVIGLGVTVLIARSLSGPISKLSHSAREIASGNMDHPVSINGPFEIKHLSMTLDAMRLAVKENIAALRKSEELYRELVENANSVILRVDTAGHINFFNEYAQKFFGYSRQEIIGRHVIGTIVPEIESTGKDLAAKIQDLTEHPEHYSSSENENMCKGGRRVWLFWTNKPILNEQGAVSEILCIGNDITDRKQAEDKLVRLGTAIEQAKETVLIMNPDGVIVYANKAVEQLTGKSREEITGEKIPFDARYSNQFRQAFEIVKAGKPWAGTISETKADNTEYSLELTITPVHDATGAMSSIVSIGRDVTRERQLEEQLRQSQKMEAIGTLAGGIAHDFNNILTAIIGYTELTANSLPQGSPLRSNLEQVLKAGSRASNLVRQILAYSRKNQEELKLINPASIFSESINFLRASIPSTIEITTKIEPVGMIKADPTQLNQMLLNLSTNAVHAMQDTGGVLLFELSSVLLCAEDIRHHPDLAAGAYVKFVVADTGTGINPAIIDRIFDPFFTTKEVGKGTGMGLAVVHGIVKSYGGDIRLQSTPGKGTLFEIVLPEIKTAVQEKPAETKALPRGTERILFIDDEAIIVEMGEKIIASLGYTVTALKDSMEALAAFQNMPEQFDLIITDQTMPRMTGYELAKAALQIRPDIPIILCTGYSETVPPEMARELGIREYIVKPIKINELAVIIRRMLDHAEKAAS